MNGEAFQDGRTAVVRGSRAKALVRVRGRSPCYLSALHLRARGRLSLGPEIEELGAPTFTLCKQILKLRPCPACLSSIGEAMRLVYSALCGHPPCIGLVRAFIVFRPRHFHTFSTGDSQDFTTTGWNVRFVDQSTLVMLACPLFTGNETLAQNRLPTHRAGIDFDAIISVAFR